MSSAPYAPSGHVETANGIPRPGGSNEYGPDYLPGLIVMPALIMGLGIVSVLVFFLVLCCRGLCSRFSCCQVKQTTNAFRHNMIAFVILISFTVFIDCFQYFYGFFPLISGFDNVSSSIEDLGDLFQNISTIASNLETAGDGVETSGNLRNICPGNMTDGYFEGMGVLGTVLAAAAGGANNGIEILPPLMYDGRDYVNLASSQLSIYLTMFFVFIMANLVVFALAGPLCKSKHLLQLMIFVAGILVILLTILCCLEMVLVVSEVK